MAIDPKLTREDLERQKFDLAGDGAVRVTIESGSSSGGAVFDGVDSGIKATVLDLASSNPLTVAVVDSAGDQITSFGGGTQYTEDAAAAANPVGTAPILVRKDTPAAEVSADGDNIAQRGTNFGAAYVTLLDAAGAPVAVGGGTQYTEDAAAAANPIGTVPMLIRKDTPGAEVSADGDNVGQRGTNYGAAYVTLLDTSGSPVSVGGGTQYTEDAAAAANPIGTALIGVRADALAGITSADGDNVAARMTDKGELYVKHADALTVASHAVTNAGTFAVQVDGAALTSLQLIDNLVLAEDAAHVSADPGVQMLGVRKATPANLSGTDGDYEPLQVSAGRLWASATIDAALPAGNNNIGDVDVASLPALPAGNNNIGDVDIASMPAVTNGGTFVTQENGAALTALQLIDNLVLAEDAAHVSADPGVQSLAVRKATPANLSGTDGDYEPLQISAGRLWASATIDAALPAGTNAIGKLAANSGVDIGDVDVTTVGTITPGTAASSLGKAEDAVHNSGDVGVFVLAVANEANTTRAADGDYIAIAVDTEGNVRTVGNRDHDAADAGEPVKIGARAINAEISAVSANNDRTDLVATLTGKLITSPYTNPENIVSGAITSAMTGTTSTSLVAAPAAGLRNYITTIICSNSHATVGTDIIIQDGSGGTTLLTIPAAAVYGGAVITLPVPLRQPTTATALYCANVTTGASTKVSAVGFKAA